MIQFESTLSTLSTTATTTTTLKINNIHFTLLLQCSAVLNEYYVCTEYLNLYVKTEGFDFDIKIIIE